MSTNMYARGEVEMDNVPHVDNPSISKVEAKFDSSLARRKEYLYEFSQLTVPGCSSWFSLLYFPVIFARSPKLAAIMAKLEGPEGVASLMYQLQAGNQESEEAAKEEAEKMVEALLNLYINSGVVAALILSIVYPMLLTPIEYSGQSVDYFGHNICVYSYYIYYCMITSALVLSLSLLFDSIQFYKHMSLWATSLESRVMYAAKGGVIFTITKSIAMVYLFAGALPFGVYAMVSPLAGAICVSGALGMVLLSNFSMVYETHMFQIMHHWAGTFFKERKAMSLSGK